MKIFRAVQFYSKELRSSGHITRIFPSCNCVAVVGKPICETKLKAKRKIKEKPIPSHLSRMFRNIRRVSGTKYWWADAKKATPRTRFSRVPKMSTHSPFIVRRSYSQKCGGMQNCEQEIKCKLINEKGLNSYNSLFEGCRNFGDGDSTNLASHSGGQGERKRLMNFGASAPVEVTQLIRPTAVNKLFNDMLWSLFLKITDSTQLENQYQNTNGHNTFPISAERVKAFLLLLHGYCHENVTNALIEMFRMEVGFRNGNFHSLKPLLACCHPNDTQVVKPPKFLSLSRYHTLSDSCHCKSFTSSTKQTPISLCISFDKTKSSVDNKQGANCVHTTSAKLNASNRVGDVGPCRDSNNNKSTRSPNESETNLLSSGLSDSRPLSHGGAIGGDDSRLLGRGLADCKNSFSSEGDLKKIVVDSPSNATNVVNTSELNVLSETSSKDIKTEKSISNAPTTDTVEMKAEKPPEGLSFRSTMLPEIVRARGSKFVTCDFEEDSAPHVAMLSSFCTPLTKDALRENVIPIRVVGCREEPSTHQNTNQENNYGFYHMLKHLFSKLTR